MDFESIKNTINQLNGDKFLANNIQNYMTRIYKENTGIQLCYRTINHLDPIEYIKVKKSLDKYFEHISKNQLSFSLTQSHYCEELFNSPSLIDKFCKDICITLYPLSLIFISNINILLNANRNIDIIVNDDLEQSYIKKMNLESHISRYFFNVYECETLVSTKVGLPIANNYSVPAIRKDNENRNERNNQKIYPAAKKQDNPKTQVKITKLSDLKINKNCFIDVKIVDHQSQSIKSGTSTKHKFILWDGEQSMYGLLFIDNTKNNNLKIPDVGTFICIEGRYVQTINKNPVNSEENVFQIKRFYPSKRVFRTDNSPVKRIELHAHTAMSSMDGVSQAADIIKRASDWGHQAIAITDHGIVQAFPDAYRTGKNNDIKIIYGTEAYLIDDIKKLYKGSGNHSLNDEFIVFDIVKTDRDIEHAEIVKIDAVKVKNCKIIDSYSSFVKASKPLNEDIAEKIGLKNNIHDDIPSIYEALKGFCEFCGQTGILVSSDSTADLNYLLKSIRSIDLKLENDSVDFMQICRLAYPHLNNHKLKTVAKHLKINCDNKQVLNKLNCVVKILIETFNYFINKGIEDLKAVDELFDLKSQYKNLKTYHIILLAKNKTGLKNLYKLISCSHVDFLYRRPRVPKSFLNAYREGIIIGSACEAGELFTAMVENADDNELSRIAEFYDYLEIQPIANNNFLIKEGFVSDKESLKLLNKRIVDIGERINKPVVATCDVHFLDPEDEMVRRIVQTVQDYENTDQPPLYLRTTEEMLSEFEYLGEDKAYEVVVSNTKSIADSIEKLELFPSETAIPVLKNAAEEITELAYNNAKKIYGEHLPEIVNSRLKRELDSIVNNGFSVLYYSAYKLVKKSLEDGYLVGSRGSVGSSLAATMIGITEVNPLPPHYICPKCKTSDFDVEKEKYACGTDLPEAICPNCGTSYVREGYDIPFEVFLGINADKVPDIDLNFSGDYQNTAHKYTEELFGKGNVFRAGTISKLKDKNAYGYVNKYIEKTDEILSKAEKDRLTLCVSGIKKTTGQHPGGMVIVPYDREIYEFTPVQWPADKKDSGFVTTHFDFNSMHDILIKLDILGHDAPTIIKIIQDIVGIDPLTIPLNDKLTLSLFSSIDALGIDSKKLFGIKTGTLGIPEFGTRFVRQMLMDTSPNTMEELIRISGLSHGEDVWLKNAQDLIKQDICTLKEAICTRDDIMNYLISHGVEKRTAFFIMEKVRKGNAAKQGFTEEEEWAFKDANIPNWFRESCLKIKYMFPKAHAVAYTIMSLRIAYCKIYYKEAFYASYFTVRANEFDGSYVIGGIEQIKNEWKRLEEKGKDASANEKSMISMLEVACEMYLRGLKFLPVDLEKSDAKQFLVEECGIRLPFLSIPKLGKTLADKIVEERTKESFFSVDDFKDRCHIPGSVIENMRNMGVFTNIKESEQVSIFDF